MQINEKLLDIKERLAGKPPHVSFEFFPPKTDELEEKLLDSVKQLEVLDPHFVSVTYGAGGTTRDRTHRIVKKIKEGTMLSPAAHLTCVNATREEIDEVAKEYWDIGVNHIVALRGDPPDMKGEYVPHPGGYEYAGDLVAGLKNLADFEISVGAYPETHPAAKSPEDDLQHLKEKLDAGATRAITQYFFDVDEYFRFIERAQAIGIDKPIVPGILPISNFEQAVKFSAMCGTSVPDWVHELFAGLDETPATRNQVSVAFAAEICARLVAGGVDELHFYTLNRADLTTAICRTLGIKPS